MAPDRVTTHDSSKMMEHGHVAFECLGSEEGNDPPR